MTPTPPRPWTHWVNHSKKRLFLVVDVLDSGAVILMEVKAYREDEERSFQQLPAVDWMILTQDTQALKPYTPRL